VRSQLSSKRGPSRLSASVVLLATASLLAAAGCGGSDDGTSPASLKSRLLPASAVPSAGTQARPRVIGPIPRGVPPPPSLPTSGGRFTVERYFGWKDPIDVVAEGISIPQATRPSEAVDVVKKAGFDAGAGELLTQKGIGPQLQLDALKFKSTGGAGDVRDYLHEQDLKQPCFKACSENVSDLKLNGISGAKAARQVPLRKLPPNAPPPFDHYVVEFTVGPYLYVGSINGGPREIRQRLFEQGAKAFYDHVKGQ
jgi:hypothetical protein